MLMVISQFPKILTVPKPHTFLICPEARLRMDMMDSMRMILPKDFEWEKVRLEDSVEEWVLARGKVWAPQVLEEFQAVEVLIPAKAVAAHLGPGEFVMEAADLIS